MKRFIVAAAFAVILNTNVNAQKLTGQDIYVGIRTV